MATYTVQSRSAVESNSGTADTVIVSQSTGTVEVLNVDGKDVLTFTVDGVTTAVAAAVEQFEVPAVAGAALAVPCTPLADGTSRVSIISGGTATEYQVSAI